MSILTGSDLFVGMKVDTAGVSRILVDTDIVWERQQGSLVIYDGGASLEHGTPVPGYLDFNVLFGTLYNSDADFYEDEEFAYISNGNIVVDGRGEYASGNETNVNLGAFGVGVNFSGYTRLCVTVSDASFDPLMSYTPIPRVQIVDTADEGYTQAQIDPNGFPYVSPLITNITTYYFDVSAVSGIKYIRLLGRMSVSKIWLDNEEER